jgi:hypothetical protein
MALSFAKFFSKPDVLPTVILSKFQNRCFPITTIRVAQYSRNSLDLWHFSVWAAHPRALPGLFQCPANPNCLAACLFPAEDASFLQLWPSLFATLLWFCEKLHVNSFTVVVEFTALRFRLVPIFWIGNGPHIWKNESHTGLDFAIVTTPGRSRSSSLWNTINISNFPPSQGRVLNLARGFVSRRPDECGHVVKSKS